MNWKAIGSVAELLGALGVIASLLYLSAQIRQGTKASRLATSHALATAARQWSDPMQADADLAWIFQVGTEAPEQLSDRQRSRFYFICFSFFRMFEDIHFQYENGALAPELWEGYKTHYGTYVKSPGLQSYWEVRRKIFRPQFAEFVDGLSLPHVHRIDAMVSRVGGEDSMSPGAIDRRPEGGA
jgi:hypothetical protein